MIIGAYAYPTVGRKQNDSVMGLRYILEEGPAMDVLIAPEYTNISYRDQITLSSLDPEMLLIPGTTMVNDGERVYNRAMILHSGAPIAQYDKRFFRTSNGLHDSDYMLQRGVLQKGTNSGVFTFADKRFGIEICYDHDQAVLKNDGVRDLDYQIILGCGAAWIRDPSVVVRKGGAVILVDGENPPSAAVEIDGKKVDPTRRIRIGYAKEDILYLYSI